jgi:hypothetical protein
MPKLRGSTIDLKIGSSALGTNDNPNKYKYSISETIGLLLSLKVKVKKQINFFTSLSPLSLAL